MARKKDLGGVGNQVVLALPPDQFVNYLRVFGQIQPEQAAGVSLITLAQLTVLGVSRDLSKAKMVSYAGALNVDIGTFNDWVHKVSDKKYKLAIQQLVIFDATLATRGGVQSTPVPTPA